MEIVGKERSCMLEIKATSETREKLKEVLKTPCKTLLLVAALVHGETECDDSEGAMNIYYKAEGVEPNKGKYVCTKEEYENLYKARGISNSTERTLAGETVVIIVRDGTVVGIC